MTAIIGEAVLRQRISDAATMRGRLAHLATLRSESTITLRVLPFDATVYRALSGDCTIVGLDDPFPSVAYAENLAGSVHVEAPIVDRFRRAYDDIDKAALTVIESAKVIEQAIREWQ